MERTTISRSAGPILQDDLKLLRSKREKLSKDLDQLNSIQDPHQRRLAEMSIDLRMMDLDQSISALEDSSSSDRK